MADHDQEPGLPLSLLDRLTDDAPESQREGRLTPWAQARELRASLCRDLTALLNTRRAEEDFAPEYTEATASVLTYGIVDFTSYNLKSVLEQDRLRRSMERAIRQFEPRLDGVEISMDPVDTQRPVLRFQISAMLRVDPAADPVLFDVTLHRDTRRIAVTGAD
jgi:type VI secretion system protein ImpF